MTRGRRLAIAWALLIQAVLVVLVGLSLSEIHSEIVSLDALSRHRTTEFAQIAQNTKDVKSLDALIVTVLRESKHPGEVQESVLFQLCRETPGCRIP